jgi:hypothetical protein
MPQLTSSQLATLQGYAESKNRFEYWRTLDSYGAGWGRA